MYLPIYDDFRSIKVSVQGLNLATSLAVICQYIISFFFLLFCKRKPRLQKKERDQYNFLIHLRFMILNKLGQLYLTQVVATDTVS